jgi:hypothetical protein
MRYCGKKCGRAGQATDFLIFRVVILTIATAQIAIISVIFWFPPYHWDTKSEWFLSSFRPLPQILYTNITYLDAHDLS